MTPVTIRRATAGVLAVRIAYGVGLVLAPRRLGGPWLGPAATEGPTQVPLRALGVRETAWHVGALVALRRGRPIRPWLAGSLAGDLTDIAATVAVRAQLPGGAAVKTGLVGGASALAVLAVGLAADE
jgi:hypothetical protein